LCQKVGIIIAGKVILDFNFSKSSVKRKARKTHLLKGPCKET